MSTQEGTDSFTCYGHLCSNYYYYHFCLLAMPIFLELIISTTVDMLTFVSIDIIASSTFFYRIDKLLPMSCKVIWFLDRENHLPASY